MLKSLTKIGTRFQATSKVKDSVLKNISFLRLKELSDKQTIVHLLGTVLKVGDNLPRGAVGSARDADLVVFYGFHSHAISEYIVVEFDDNTFVPCCADANSNAKNFREIGQLLDGNTHADMEAFLDAMKDPECGMLVFRPYGGVEVYVIDKAHANTGNALEPSFYAPLLKDANVLLDARKASLGRLDVAYDVEFQFSAYGGASRDDFDDICELVYWTWLKLDEDVPVSTVTSAVRVLVVDEKKRVTELTYRDVTSAM